MHAALVGNQLHFVIDDNIVGSNVPFLVEMARYYMEEYAGQYRAVILDLQKTEFVDSRGISFIVGLAKTVQKGDRHFGLINVSKDVGDLFKLMRLDEVFAVSGR